MDTEADDIGGFRVHGILFVNPQKFDGVRYSRGRTEGHWYY